LTLGLLGSVEVALAELAEEAFPVVVLLTEVVFTELVDVILGEVVLGALMEGAFANGRVLLAGGKLELLVLEEEVETDIQLILHNILVNKMITWLIVSWLGYARRSRGHLFSAV
jgi:hypothetical protein